MTALAYPSSLPGPTAAAVSADERRQIAELDGVRITRGIQNDRSSLYSATFIFKSSAECAAFRSWWKDTLIYGGAWFTSTWPWPEGLVSRVRRFVTVPRWDWLPSVGWRVTAVLETRSTRGVDPIVGRYIVMYPTGVSGTFGTKEAAVAAAMASTSYVSPYPSPYAPGGQYVSYKTSANPVLNCFTGGANVAVAHTYVDYYYATDLPVTIADYSGGGVNWCDFLALAGSTVGGGAYLNREFDPVVTGNNVDTTPWGIFKLVATGPGGVAPLTPAYPMFQNNCTNYPFGTFGYPQVLMAPFTIIRGLDD